MVFFQRGKAFFISGHILQNTLKDGSVTCSELSDVVNALLQGAGFVLRKYTSAGNIVHTMQMLNELCKIHEPISVKDTFWNMYNEVSSVLLSGRVECLFYSRTL